MEVYVIMPDMDPMEYTTYHIGDVYHKCIVEEQKKMKKRSCCLGFVRNDIIKTQLHGV